MHETTRATPAAVRDRPRESRLPGVLRYARLNRHEIAGSLGDLGTFLPLLLGMAAQNGLDFGTALFFAGLFSLVTGLTFSIPMAVLFFFQAEDGIRALYVTGVQTCALPI